MNSRGLLYCHCYYYHACIFLLLGFLLREGLSQQQSAIERCREETDELYSNSFGVAQQVSNIDSWTELQRSTIATATAATDDDDDDDDDDGAKLNSVCTIQSNTKTTCLLDYANVTDSSAWCLDVPDTIYVETSFVFKCSASNSGKKGSTLFYTVRNRPACYAFTETSLCYNGYDNDAIESIERETYNELTSEATSPSTTNTNNNEWGDTREWETCVQFRFVVSDPILSEAVAIVAETPATTPYGSSSPTTTSAPTRTSAPSSNPTATLKPTTSFAPTESPTALSCKDESLNLISSQQQSEDGGDDNENEIAKGLTKIQDLMMMMDDDNGNGFMKHCNTMSTSATNLDGNPNTRCEFNYDDIIISSNTHATEIETETAENKSIVALCRNANAVYVEDSVSITCTSVSSSSAVTRLVVRNKPSCRSKKCNADGVREVATIEFERWIRMTLEKGIVNVATESSSGEEEEDDEGKMSIMAGPQSCIIDKDEGGFLVAVGGSSVSTTNNNNNGDGDIGGPIEPTDECRAGTDQVNGIIEIYNQNIITQHELIDYIDTDLRQICGSPKPNVLACNFDWNELFSKTDADLKSNCLAEEDANNGSSGQYVESSFQVSCVNAEGELTMTNTNVPACIGKPCSPAQSLYLLKDDYKFLANQLFEEGWSCTTEVLSVYAPHFDPFYSVYDADTDGNQTLQFEEIVAKKTDDSSTTDADDNPSDDIEDGNGNSDESGNVNSNININSNSNNNNVNIDVEEKSPVTQPVKSFPTPAPMGGGGLSGPKFGSIFDAVPTKAPSGNTEVETTYSQSSSDTTGTVTSRIITILLLPIVLVMI